MKEFFIKYKKIVLMSAVVLSIAFIAGVFIWKGYYPIAIAGGEFITARQFDRNYRATSIYYENLKKTYFSDDNKVEDLKPERIRALVLEQLVENSLIDKKVREEAGKDLDYLVQRKISDIKDNSKIKEATQKLYGWNVDDFKKEILIPQAKKEILAARLFLKNQDFNDWLKEARKSSQIFILSSQFYWDNGEVKTK